MTVVTFFVALAGLAFLAYSLAWAAPALTKVIAGLGAMIAVVVLHHMNRVLLFEHTTGRNIIEDGFGQAIMPGFAETGLREETTNATSSLISQLLQWMNAYAAGKKT